MKIDNQTLRLFADTMATCLAAGMPPQRALEMSRAGLRSKPLDNLVRIARARCEEGLSVSEALEPGRKVLPHYFLPVLQAGEAAGRLVEAFQLLQEHGRRIAPSMRLVRNTWLYPLVCIVAGWIARIGIFLCFGRVAAAVDFFWYSFGVSSLLVLAAWLLLKLPRVRTGVDTLLLRIPILRETELGLGMVLFFSTFRLAYEAGGLGVLLIFDLACQTMRNSVMRRDWQKARPVLEQHGPFDEAFGRVTLLNDEFKGLIATGAMSGQLDQSLSRLVASVTQQLGFTLQAFNSVFQRLVSLSVAFSIAETVMICTWY